MKQGSQRIQTRNSAVRHVLGGCFLVLFACGPGDGDSRGPGPDGALGAVGAPECAMPSERTVVRAEDGAVLETWEFLLSDVSTDALPTEAAFLEYREAIERDGADLRRPVADAPTIDSEELAAIWEDEFFNTDLVFDEGLGEVVPISCLDALLFARQAGRVSQLIQPTEFIASVLRRGTPDAPRIRVVFAAGSEMFVPRGFYGIDLVEEYLAAGWSYWYTIHNHTIQKNGDRRALGVPVPSTSDVALYRSLAGDLGLESARVTNGFFTFTAGIEEMDRFRVR